MTYPSEEYRLLAVFRLWNVIRYFYPYLSLIDDWEPVLAEFVPKALAAADGKAYALTMLEMAARVTDGHTRLSGHPALAELLGVARPPVQVRIVEDQPTIVKLLDAGAATAAGVAPRRRGRGGCGRAGRGQDEAARSLRDGLHHRGQARETRGPAAAGSGRCQRRVHRTRRRRRPSKRQAPALGEAAWTIRAAPPAYRALSAEIGYADLTRLEPSEVDPMFEALKGTKNLILDMRGYPNGTAWSIAPHINVKRAKTGARFRRPLWTGFDLQSDDLGGTASYAFEQPLPRRPASSTRAAR